jgi:hypothetical protein
MTMDESAEKAGFGGSIPSLATASFRVRRKGYKVILTAFRA